MEAGKWPRVWSVAMSLRQTEQLSLIRKEYNVNLESIQESNILNEFILESYFKAKDYNS